MSLKTVGTLRSSTDESVLLELAFHPDAVLLLLTNQSACREARHTIAIAPDQLTGLRDVINSLILDLNVKGL